MPAGRPTDCTLQVIENFAKYMRAGMMVTGASALVGIVPQTARNWLHDGEAALLAAGNDIDAIEDGNQRIWAQFFATVTRAEALALSRNLAIMQTAAQDRPKVMVRLNRETNELEEMVPGDWRAAAEFLKMRKPDSWGMRKQATELTGAGGGAVQVEHLRHLSEAELDAIIAGGGDADSD